MLMAENLPELSVSVNGHAVLKGTAHNSYPIHFCQTQLVSPYGPLAVHSVCALTKTSGVGTQ